VISAAENVPPPAPPASNTGRGAGGRWPAGTARRLLVMAIAGAALGGVAVKGDIELSTVYAALICALAGAGVAAGFSWRVREAARRNRLERGEAVLGTLGPADRETLVERLEELATLAAGPRLEDRAEQLASVAYYVAASKPTSQHGGNPIRSASSKRGRAG
jgi:hypothetical protein